MKSVSIFISETLRLERLWCFPGTISSWRSFPSYKRLREKLAWENNIQFIFQEYFNIWNMFVSMRSLSMYMYIKFMNINYYRIKFRICIDVYMQLNAVRFVPLTSEYWRWEKSVFQILKVEFTSESVHSLWEGSKKNSSPSMKKLPNCK